MLPAVWQGIPVALKQWDLAKDEEAAERAAHEMAMYTALRHLQGTFVPRVLFRACEGTFLFLGLQRGKPLPRDFAHWTAAQRQGRAAALERLAEAGLSQTDDEARNYVLLSGEDGVERVAAVDLESVQSVSHPAVLSARSAATTIVD